MSDSNPYAPPQANVEDLSSATGSEFVLADRGERLGASFLDGLILAVPTALIIWAEYSLVGLQFWAPVPGAQGIILGVIASILASGVYLAINYRFLVRDGQTLGKRWNKIRIAKPDGSVPSMRDSFIRRYVLNLFLSDIPFIGGFMPLIDVLLIFRKSRKCLHDDLAGTIVVKV